MIFLLISTVAIASGALLLVHLLPLRGAVERIVATLIVAQAAITATLLVAGLVLRSFAPETIFLLSAAELLAVVVVCGLRGWVVPARSVAATARNALNGLREALSRRPVLWLCLVAGACVAWRAILAVRLGVLDYDGFSYHLVTVDVWLQEGVIGRVPQRIWSDIYPANGELLTLWLMAFVRNDRLAAITALASLPLAVASTVGISRVLGATRPWAVFAGALLAITPAVIALTTTTYVDIAAAADLAAAWYLGLLALGALKPGRRTVLLALTGVAIGLAIGTKQTVLVPAVVWGAFVVTTLLARSFVRWLRTRRADRPGPWPRGPAWRLSGVIGRMSVDLFAVAAPAAALGSYWYLRNLLVYANPFWPFDVGPFRGVGTFGEYLAGSPLAYGGASSAELILRSWTADFGLTHYPFDVRMGGFGIHWPIVLVLAGVAVWALATSPRPPNAILDSRLATIAIVGSALIALAVTPMSWWARLTLFVVAAALALAAVALSRLPRRVALVATAGLLVGATWSVGVATATSNASIDDSGRPATLLRLGQLVYYGPPDELGMWSQCRAFGLIPRGGQVALEWIDLRRVSRDGQTRIAAFGFNLPHLVVGHELERRLVPPIAPTREPAELRARAAAVGATHLVLLSDGPSAAAARQDRAAFRSLGISCAGRLSVPETEIFELTDPS